MKAYTLPLLLLTVLIATWNAESWSPDVQELTYRASFYARNLFCVVSPIILLLILGGRLLQCVKTFFTSWLIVAPIVTFSNIILLFLPYIFFQWYGGTISLLVPHYTPPSLQSWHAWITGGQVLAGLLLAGVAFLLLPVPRGPMAVLGLIAESLGERLLRGLTIIILPPLLIGGSVLLHTSGYLDVLKDNAQVYWLLLGVYAVYTCGLWSIASKNSRNRLWSYISGLSAPLGVAFFSMSSLVTMAVLAPKVKRMVKHPHLVNLTLPILSNVHSVASTIFSAGSALLILSIFHKPFPDFYTYLAFIGSFLLAKFCLVAAPGAITLLMLPLLERYMNFTPEMSNILLVTDVMTDCVATVGNVFCNTAMTIIVDDVFDRFKTRRMRIRA